MDRRTIADIVEKAVGPDPEADAFAQVIVDPDTESITVDRLVVRLFQFWKRQRRRPDAEP